VDKKRRQHVAAARLRLDNAQLPKLLQVNALSAAIGRSIPIGTAGRSARGNGRERRAGRSDAAVKNLILLSVVLVVALLALFVRQQCQHRGFFLQLLCAASGYRLLALSLMGPGRLSGGACAQIERTKAVWREADSASGDVLHG